MLKLKREGLTHTIVRHTVRVLDIVCLCLGVDVEAAKRLEEEQIMKDARTWLTEGPPSDVQHPRTGATPLHVAAAKGYMEAIKYVSHN